MPPRTQPSVRRRIIKGTVALALLGGTTYALARTLEFPEFEVFASEEREHLDPIPIDAAQACSHVEAIHTQLEDFEGNYMVAMFGMDAATADAILHRTPRDDPIRSSDFRQVPWPTVKSELDASAILLDATIANGIPSFPPRIQEELTKVREQIAVGRLQLGAVDAYTDLTHQTHAAFDEGQVHAGYAGDLVGDQCAVPLGAHNFG